MFFNDHQSQSPFHVHPIPFRSPHTSTCVPRRGKEDVQRRCISLTPYHLVHPIPPTFHYPRFPPGEPSVMGCAIWELRQSHASQMQLHMQLLSNSAKLTGGAPRLHNLFASSLGLMSCPYGACETVWTLRGTQPPVTPLHLRCRASLN